MISFCRFVSVHDFLTKPLNLVSTLVFFLCVLFSRVCVHVCELRQIAFSPPELLPLKSVGDPFRSSLVLMGERENRQVFKDTPPLSALSAALHHSIALFMPPVHSFSPNTHFTLVPVSSPSPSPLLFFPFLFFCAKSQREKKHYEYFNLQKCH